MVELHGLDGHLVHGHGSARRRGLTRVAVLLLVSLALVLSTPALGWVASARAGRDDGAGAAERARMRIAQTAPKRAVIVAGPVHANTTRYLRYARAVARAASAHGMDVQRIFHPAATKARVKKYASGADLFVYIGHGNGYPGTYGTLDESTKNGLGLNPDDPAQRTTSNVLYKGADWLRANIALAPNAVVILSHLSYASGNASSGMTIPSRRVAIERIDNFANGFLAAGARVVWALGWQRGADIIDALYSDDATMDALFMTRYRDDVGPMNGWIGADPGYYPSTRTPGARIHVDPHPTYGYLRGITGDLGFTTTEWRDAAARPPDTVAPVITEVSVHQAPTTISSGGSRPALFTPNGDGISDVIRISHVLSEDAFLNLRISKGGKVVRDTALWALAGPGITTWDGRRDDGEYVGEGPFSIEITPSDRAGNVGATAGTAVTVLSSLRAPRVTPALFYPSDGDDLAPVAELKARLTRPASVSWVIKDASGAIVRHGLDQADRGPGLVSFAWDGTDDAGGRLPDGVYTGRVRVVRPQGAYGHEVTMHLMPFRLMPTRWKLRRGDSVGLVVRSAEPITGRLSGAVKQPGLDERGFKVTRLDATSFRATLTTRADGKRGRLTIRLEGTDRAGGTQAQAFKLRLR
jgi:hypothetical protein